MESVLVDKIVEDLEAEGMEVVSTSKPNRSFLYKLGKFYRSSSLLPALSLVIKDENNEEKKLIAIQKDSAEEEYNNLKTVNEELKLNGELNVPSPYLLLKDDNIVVMEDVSGKSLTELFVKRCSMLGYGKSKLDKIHEEVGHMLAKLHNSTLLEEMYSVDQDFNEKFDKFKENVSDCEIIEDLKKMGFSDVDVSKCFKHGDIAPDNIRYADEQIHLVDWSEASYGNPLEDLHRSEKIYKNMNKYFPFIDIEKFWQFFFETYRNKVDIDFDDKTMLVSRLNYVMKAINKKPKRYEKKTYRNMLEDTVVRLKDIDS